MSGGGTYANEHSANDTWKNIELKLAALIFIIILYLISRKEAKAIDVFISLLQSSPASVT